MLKLQTCVENAFFHHISSAERNTLCEHGLGGSFLEWLIVSQELLMSFLALAFGYVFALAFMLKGKCENVSKVKC